jgi:hypothetical protein
VGVWVVTVGEVVATGEVVVMLWGPRRDGTAACWAGMYGGSRGALERVDTADVGVTV